MRVNSMSPELLEITDMEYGEVSHNVKFYARTKEQSDTIYSHYNNFIVHRSDIPNISVFTTRGVTSVDDDWMCNGTQQSEITNTLVLGSVFSNVLQNEFSDIISQYSHSKFDLPTQPILKDAICVKGGASAKLFSANEIVSFDTHKDVDLTDSD